MNMNLEKYIAAVPDFPEKGILFRDITPLLQDKEAYHYVIDKIIEFAKSVGADVVVGPESRGFIFGAPVAYGLNAGFVPFRKPGKLPRKTIEYSYSLEYGKNTLCMHEDALKTGQKVLIIDDLLATGGTVHAACKMVEQVGAEVVGLAFLIQLDDLHGEKALEGYNILSLIHY